MERPKHKDYYPKDFLIGKYEDDLEKYCDHLEKQVINHELAISGLRGSIAGTRLMKIFRK